jgi:hypothetical protein
MAQYVSPWNCPQTPPLQSLSERQGAQRPKVGAEEPGVDP